MSVTTEAGSASEERRAIRLAGLAGILSIVLGVIGSIVDDMKTFPGTGASGAEIASYVVAHRPELLGAMLLNSAAVTLWLAFGAGVWVWLRRASGGETVLSACLLVGLVSFATLLLAGFTSFFVLVYRGAGATDPRLLYDLAFGLLAMSGGPTALALGAYAALAARIEAVPGWTAALAVVGAAAHLALFASFLTTTGFFSLQGGVIIAIPATLFAWILGAGVAMRRRPELAGAEG